VPEPEHEAVVEVPGVVHPVGISDQRVRQRAQVQQLVPVGVVAGQPADLDAEDDPDMAKADVGDELLESFAGGHTRPGTAQVGVNHLDLVGIPAQRHRPLGQLILAGQ
jgi:hypothetical protein